MVTTVCAKCGSRLRPEAAWCSLCLAPRDGAPRDLPTPTAADDEETDLPEGWEDGVVVTEPRPGPGAGRRAEALASADLLMARLAVSEKAAVRASRLGRLQSEVARRTGLTSSGAGAVIAVAGGVALLVGLIVLLTVVGLLL